MELSRLKAFADENNIGFSDEQLDLFSRFGKMVLEKNKVMNLTAITSEEEMEIKHFIDSLESAPYIKEAAGDKFSLIDVGTGAGFPGIPLKIAFPEADFVLMDSLGKRIDFINDAAEELELQNITAISARAEELARTDCRGNFDFCVSRAVAGMNVLLEYCLPFVKVGGTCILYKSGDYSEEMKEAEEAMEILGGEFAGAREFVLPDSDIRRSLVFINKIRTTPDKYPRRPGKPSKSPIGK